MHARHFLLRLFIVVMVGMTSVIGLHLFKGMYTSSYHHILVLASEKTTLQEVA